MWVTQATCHSTQAISVWPALFREHCIIMYQLENQYYYCSPWNWGKNLLDFGTGKISVLPVPVNGYQVKDFVDPGICNGNAIYALVYYVGLVNSIIYWSCLIFTGVGWVGQTLISRPVQLSWLWIISLEYIYRLYSFIMSLKLSVLSVWIFLLLLTMLTCRHHHLVAF